MVEILHAYNQAGGVLLALLFVSSLIIWFTYFNALFHFRERFRCCDLRLVMNDGQMVPGFTYRLVNFVAAHYPRRPLDVLFEEARQHECQFFLGGFKVMKALVLSASLCGLLGTVMGMIETFEMVSMAGSTSAELVSGGISKALVTTQAGLVVALLGSLALAHLSRLVVRLNHLFDSHEVVLNSIYGVRHETT
jgi:biopolymer transport protein ExbB